MQKDDKQGMGGYYGGNIAEETAEPSVMPIGDQNINNKRIWRIDDVAKFLGCSVGHIYNLSSKEKIPRIKKGKFLFFIPSEILEWVTEGDFYDESKN